jgi:hypothetical protein
MPNLRVIILNPPFALFVSWFVSIFFLGFGVSDFTYPHLDNAIQVAFWAILSFSIPYYLITSLGPRGNHSPARPINLSAKKVSQFNSTLSVLLLALLIVNIHLDGAPPLLGLMGIEALGYKEWGRGKSFAMALATTLFLTSTFESKKRVSIVLKIFAVSIILMYLARGTVMRVFVQYVLLIMLLHGFRVKHVILIFAVIVGGSFFMEFIGSLRSGNNLLKWYFSVSREYYQSNPVFLWMSLYFSQPLSNLMWMIETEVRLDIGFSFLYRALPPIISLNLVEYKVSDLSHLVIDNASTYLSSAVISMGYYGVIVYNCIWGLVFGSYRLFLKESNIVLDAIMISVLYFAFFADFLFFFATVGQLLLVLLFLRHSHLQPKGLSFRK